MSESTPQRQIDVSVVVPVHNAQRWLDDAVRSVLDDHHRPAELIIVDDGSTDRSTQIATEIADEFDGVRFIRQPNAGPAAARNAGLRTAVCDVIGFLDADDQWTPGALVQRFDALHGDSQVDIVLGRMQVIQTADDGQSVPIGEPAWAHMFGAALIRRSCFERIGEIDASMRFSEDLDWFLRSREGGLSMSMIAATTLLYRNHAGNMTRGMTAHQLGISAAIRASLGRRRVAPQQ